MGRTGRARDDRRSLRRKLEAAGPCLAVVVRREREIVPFHADSKLRRGDYVATLRAERRTDAGPESFQRVVRESPILDLEMAMTADQFFQRAATALSSDDAERVLLLQGLRQREAVGSTVLAPGLAIPHVSASGAGPKQMLIARVRKGIAFADQAEPVHAVFVLVRTPANRGFHLQALANIARVAGQPDFRERWLAAEDVEQLRGLMLDRPHSARAARCPTADPYEGAADATGRRAATQ